MSVLNMVVSRHPGNTEPVKAKEELIFHCGFRRFRASPLFSQHTAGKHQGSFWGSILLSFRGLWFCSRGWEYGGGVCRIHHFKLWFRSQWCFHSKCLNLSEASQWCNLCVVLRLLYHEYLLRSQCWIGVSNFQEMTCHGTLGIWCPSGWSLGGSPQLDKAEVYGFWDLEMRWDFGQWWPGILLWKKMIVLLQSLEWEDTCSMSGLLNVTHTLSPQQSPEESEKRQY